MTPFKAIYGKEADELPHYNEGESQIESVDMLLKIREETMDIMKKNLSKAQSRMKSQADRKRSDVVFKLGDWVLVKLQPYRQTSVANRIHNKLCQKYFRPYEVEKIVNKVAYRLKLPEGIKQDP